MGIDNVEALTGGGEEDRIQEFMARQNVTRQQAIDALTQKDNFEKMRRGE